MLLDYSSHPEAQDMIVLIQNNKSLDISDVIKYSINEKIYSRIIEAGWGRDALAMWGHDNPDRTWNTLDLNSLKVEIDFNEQSMLLVNYH